MSEWITGFWNANSGNIIVSLIAGFIFFVLGPIGVWFSGRKIRLERTRKAKEVLLDLFEGMLVGEETIDEQKLSILFRATEREIDVNLGQRYDIESLLEDVVLRFEKSKHLDAGQKDKYANEVRRLSQEIKVKTERPKEGTVPRPYAKIIDNLKEALTENDLSTANKTVTELEERLVTDTTSDEFPLNVFRVYRRLYERNPLLFLSLLLLTIIAYFIFIYFVIFIP